ncbi:GTP pyrophosphokinase [Longirhabdus pacifica]|uniref:GTP pyrophosphokinase n=1 Tax=Longirhabdus pacifica TaxID=2305227 RepID=UPI001008F6A5|nr:GTP pyrophosphokinase family protein [Longirhabdus pacifica]
MDHRDWGKFLIPYEQAVEELKVKFKSLRSEMHKRHQISPIEFVTGRVKKVSSILEKANLLKVPMEKLEEGIEDIAGIRIMCQFVEDIEIVAEKIRSREDMEILYEKDYVRNTKSSGYRSYHIIIKYPVMTALGKKIILAEIQVRTLSMNFWATIEHSLRYKYKESLPSTLQARLRRAAEAAFSLDEEMSSIREEITEAQKFFENKSHVVSTVLNGIQELYYFNQVEQADMFQKQFNDLWNKEDLYGLRKLSIKIQTELAQNKTPLKGLE